MNENLTEIVAPSVWWGWGDPARSAGVPEHVARVLVDELGARPAETPPVPLADVRMPASRLSADDLAALAETGCEVLTDRAERAAHAGGKSYPDLWRRRHGDCEQAPDAVLCPHDEAEVAALLVACERLGVAVVPYGGGTSVVGGVQPEPGGFRAVVTVDLRHLAAVISIEPENLRATFGAGLRGPAMEAALAARGCTLGHYPQSHQEAGVGGYVATRSAGQASTGYGRSDQLVERVRICTPRGVLDLGGSAPASAAGPRVIELVIGSEGTLGIITEVTMRLHPAPAAKRYAGWLFESFDAAREALRDAVHAYGKAQLPAVCRVSDEEETRIALAQIGGAKAAVVRKYATLRGLRAPCLGIFVWEGDPETTGLAKHQIERTLSRHGAVRLGPVAARSWEKGRFGAPYLRDHLLGRGLLVETLETAQSWSAAVSTYRAVQDALRDALGDRASVQCHISHVYETGVSLYFTFLAAEEDDPLAQWRRAKAAASEAIVATGATITHHHAVGIDHAPYLAAETGELALDVLRSVKATLDPAGILNPGKLMNGGRRG
ncbi:FAD-binding oxidoreductase [Cumulibacter manganitolerans]|uniref:FAD-binding oxidoreductase n=1 Tax=Cumulibacter manganitolerans TaxID=1884992 RepID=UPI001294F6A2|nr:FAD-binding oxidoreductase [Cumulibacter manganitolerans]